MNGALPRAYFSSGVDCKRLCAALAASCLAHAALFLVPYFGIGKTAWRQPRVLDVRLEEAGGKEPLAGKDAARGAGLLPLPAPTFYRTDQLTKPPRPVSQPKLDVPKAVARSVNGKVVLKLWIDERGRVVSAEVESSELPDTVSGTAAEAFGKVRFVPGEIDGRRVRTVMRVEVTYGRGLR